MSDMKQRHAMPPAADHEHHDSMLVGQLVAGDQLAPEQQAEAQRLVTSCGACAALAADLRVVSAAVAQEPVPPRRRDFRLSPEQAEALSGNPVTRFLRRLSLPSARAFQPAAAGVLSIGLLFVVAGYAWPDGGTITVQSAPNYVDWSPSAPASVSVEPDADVAQPPAASDVDDGAAAGDTDVDAAAGFFETLPESQAGDLDRTSQKSVASEAEAPEAGALEMMVEESVSPRAAAPSPPGDEVSARAADADRAPDAALGGALGETADVVTEEAAEDSEYRAQDPVDAASVEESLGSSDALDGIAQLDAVTEEPASRQDPGTVVSEPEAEIAPGEIVSPESEATIGATEDDTLAADVVQAPTDETGLTTEAASSPADAVQLEDLLLVLGGLLVLSGGGLLVLGWVARRARDPLAP